MTPDPTLIEQLEALKKALAPLNWKDTVPDDLQSEVRMLFNEALAGGPNMNGDAGPTLTPNHAYDCILATERIATLQGSAALPSEQSELMLLKNVGKLVREKLALQHAMQPAVERLAAWEAGLAKNHPGWNVPDNKRVEIRCGDLRLLRDAMRATTPTAPDQDTGASVPDQALAVPVEPVARLDPAGFDPSRDTLYGGTGELRLSSHTEATSACEILWASDFERAAIATEARRAETVKQGSVHEGAGPEDIAHD